MPQHVYSLKRKTKYHTVNMPEIEYCAKRKEHSENGWLVNCRAVTGIEEIRNLLEDM